MDSKSGMNLEEGLKKVNDMLNAQTCTNQEFNFDAAEKRFLRLVNFYNLDKKYLQIKKERKKVKKGEQLYYLHEKDVEFICFVENIYNRDPASRKNAKDAEYNLDNYRTICDYIHSCVEKMTYPSINLALSKSTSTAEFCSIELLSNFSDKFTKALAYACENNHVDFSTYNDLNKYLDTLLYTYSVHSKVYELINQWYPDPFFRMQKINSDNKCVSFEREDGSSDHTKTYQGVSAYLSRLFNDIYNPISRESEITSDIPNENNTLIINYDFEDIDSLTEFLHFFVKIKHDVSSKIYRFSERDDDDIPTQIIKVAYNSMINRAEENTNKYFDNMKIEIACLFRSISTKLRSKDSSEIKNIYSECEKKISEFMQKIVRHLSPYNRWIELLFNHAMYILSEIVKIEYHDYVGYLSFNFKNDKFDNADIELRYRTAFFLTKMILTSELYLYNPNNLCTCQINYKGFKMHLDMIYDPCPPITNTPDISFEMYKSFHTPERANKRIQDLISVLAKTEEELNSFSKSEISSIIFNRNKLYTAINTAIGAYFRETPYMEKQKIEEEKKKEEKKRKEEEKKRK